MRIGGRAAGDDVRDTVAGQRLPGRRNARQDLDIGGQCIGGQRGPDLVAARAGRLDDAVAGADMIEVVAEPARQLVRRRAAVQYVVAIASGQDVGELVPGQNLAARRGSSQILDIGSERVGGKRGADLVGARALRLDDRIAHRDDVDVVAEPARELVRAGAAVDHVVAGGSGDEIGDRVAGQGLAARQSADQIFDIGGQVVCGEAGADRVGPGAGAFADQVGHIVDEIEIVAAAAVHMVDTGAAVEQIVAVGGDQDVAAVAGADLVIAGAGEDGNHWPRRW